MSKVIKVIEEKVYNCRACPFVEVAFSEEKYKKKIDDCYDYTCWHTKKEVPESGIPSWCVLKDWKAEGADG